jgi:hypothetical protein
MESDWFRAGAAGRMRAVQVNDTRSGRPGPARGEAQPGRASQPRIPDAPRPTGPSPAATPYGTASARPSADAPWRTSANDERWRRAEQVRDPASDGLTSSGLPRRVPRANLVAGTAEHTPLGGPQVSRAPEEVRGRLTNLRRGIQQGRRAGGSEPYQGGSGQPNGGTSAFGNGAYGPEHQER